MILEQIKSQTLTRHVWRLLVCNQALLLSIEYRIRALPLWKSSDFSIHSFASHSPGMNTFLSDIILINFHNPEGIEQNRGSRVIWFQPRFRTVWHSRVGSAPHLKKIFVTNGILSTGKKITQFILGVQQNLEKFDRKNCRISCRPSDVCLKLNRRRAILVCSLKCGCVPAF